MTWSILHEYCENPKLLNNDRNIITRCQTHPEETAFVDEHGFTPFHLFCFVSSKTSTVSMKVVQCLLDVNDNVLTTKDLHGDTPLHIALHCSTIDINLVRYMIDKKPPILSIANKEGLMPLHVSCRYCPSRLDIIALVGRSYPQACFVHIKSGYLVTKSNKDNIIKNNDVSTSPRQVHQYFQQQHFLADTNLLKHTANSIDFHYHDYDTQIRDGSYPIHIALSSSNKDKTSQTISLIDLLLDIGNDVCFDEDSDRNKDNTNTKMNILQMKNKFGQIPMMVAKENGYCDDVIMKLNPDT